MAFASPPSGALQARLRARVKAATQTPRWQSSARVDQAWREARAALRAGTVPEVAFVSDDSDANSSSGRAVAPPPRSSTEPSTASPKYRTRSMPRPRRRLFVTLSSSDSDSEAEDGSPLVHHADSNGGSPMLGLPPLRTVPEMRSWISPRVERGAEGLLLEVHEISGENDAESALENTPEGSVKSRADDDSGSVTLGENDSEYSSVDTPVSDPDWIVRSVEELSTDRSTSSSSGSSCTEVISSIIHSGSSVTNVLGTIEEETSSIRRYSGSLEKEGVRAPLRERNTSSKTSDTKLPRGRGNHTKPAKPPLVVDLCDSDDEVNALAGKMSRVSLGRAPGWLTGLSRADLARTREAVAQRLLREFDKTVLDGRLGTTTTVKWNVRLLTTAGCTRLIARGAERSAGIDLSTKVLDEWRRLYVTLAHEMCHAAAWIIDGVGRPPHGDCFKKWARVFNKWDPELEITRCHSFEIRTKFNYRCDKCGHTWGRHSRSIDTKRVRCSCSGTIVLLPIEKGKK